MAVVRRGLTRSWRRSALEFDAVADWLIGFGVATQAERQPCQPWTDVYVAAAHGSPRPLRNWLSHCLEVAQRTGAATMAVEQHWDPGPWNIFVDHRGRPFFVDWETDPRRPPDSLGPPLADLLYFVTYWYMWSSGASTPQDEVDTLLRLFHAPTPADSDVVLVRNAIDRALSAFELDRSCVPALATAVWAERMLYNRARRQSLGPGSSPLASRADAFLEGLVALDGATDGDGDWWQKPVGTRLIMPSPSRRPSLGRRRRPPAVPS